MEQYQKSKEKFKYLKTQDDKTKTEKALYSLLYELTFPYNMLNLLQEPKTEEELQTLYYQTFLNADTKKSLCSAYYPYLEANYIIHLTETNELSNLLTGSAIMDYGTKITKERQEFFKQYQLLSNQLEKFINMFDITLEQEVLKTMKKYIQHVNHYVNEAYPKEKITYSVYCRINHLNNTTFCKYLKSLFPEFYHEYKTALPEYLIDKDGMKKERYQRFEQLLQLVDSKEHMIDAIDYYMVTKEKPSGTAIAFQARTENSYSDEFFQFVKRNESGEDLTLEEILDGTKSFGLMVNGKIKYASKEELQKIYFQLIQKEIPVFDKSIVAQLRRNWNLNTEIDIEEYLNKKEKQLQKVYK